MTQSGGLGRAPPRPGCSNPGRLFAVFSPLPRMIQSVGPGFPPDDPVRELVPLSWNEESNRAFEGMKQALLSAVGLILVDPDQGFVLRTDASDYAVGAVLEQVLDDRRHVPVAFWSRVLAEAQRRTWTPREKEAYAIVMALRKWAGYIALHPVTVCTDHQSLQSWQKEHVDTPSGPAS